MNEHDREWDALSAVWKSQRPESEASLRALVRRRRGRLVATVAGEVALIVAFALLSWLVIRDGFELWKGVWLVTLWMFVAVAVAFAIWNRKGTWAPLGEGVDDYIRLSRLRCERQRRTIVFVIILFAAEVLAVAVQLAWLQRLTVTAVSVLFFLALIIAFWIGWTKRRIGEELGRIAEYERLSGSS